MKSNLRRQPTSRNRVKFLARILSASLTISTSSVLATPRAPLPALPHAATTLFHTRFDEAYWPGHERASLVMTDYGMLVESFSGYALQRTGKSVVPFVVPALDATGRLSVATDAGAFGFWFKPDWTSAVAGGGGPGYAARLVEVVAVGDKQAAVAWSLQTSADGSALALVGADGMESLLKAGIGWVPGEWHWLVINYGAKTELWIDGALAAEGAGTVTLPPQVAGLVLGSSVLGSETAGGEFEDVYAFRRPLTERQVGFYFQGMKKRSLLGPITSEEEAALAERRAKRKAELEALGESDGGGGVQMLRMSGPVVDCVTNSPLYITNTVCVFDTNQGWTVTFDVQGTNGPVDIFTTTNLSGNGTNTQWVWLERGPSCSTYQYTNQPTSQSYYILGTMQDSDSDGLTDAFEQLVSHTNPLVWTNLDTDGDGMPDAWEIAHGLDPLVANGGDDPDADGLTNLQEYLGGTRPLVAEGFFVWVAQPGANLNLP